MALLDGVGDFVKATAGEIGHHPLQALGAALGVPGYDPFFGGLLNNHEGGALLSPTGNFTSSAWGEMYKDNPNATRGLDLFHRINSIADIIAPAVAGGYAIGSSGLLGNSGTGGLLGNSGTGGLLGSSGTGSAAAAPAAGASPNWLNYARLGMSLMQHGAPQQQGQPVPAIPLMQTGRPGGAYGRNANGGSQYSLLDDAPTYFIGDGYYDGFA